MPTAWSIEVALQAGDVYHVTVKGSGGTYSYEVVATREHLAGFSLDGRGAADVVRASFEFLLEREPPASILSRFELPVIARYFPEYATEIARRVG